ncbi:unnamed protein product [Rotaria sp. Silwood1]|nr:unnamed protein product [Rotaria sp. Silwood1]CAF4812297.1 unnamed protein product [Rotaria sp. Silwood1]
MMNQQNQDTVLEMIPTGNSCIASQKILSITNKQLETILERLTKLQSPSVNVSNAIGNPGPLGLASFSLPTIMLSVFNAGSNLIDPRLELVVLPVAFFYGGLTQFVATWYSSAAAIINTTFKKTLLPTGAYKEKGKGKSSTIISTRF